MSGLPAVAAPYLAATLVLGAAGVAKAVRPDDTARALQAAGLPAGRRLVRAGSLIETAVASAALLWPGPVTGALIAVAYLAFAGFVVLALGRGWSLSSCGCFGRPDSRPTYLHAVLDLGAAAASIGWAARAGGSRWAPFFHQPWHGAPLALVSFVIAGLAYFAWTVPAPGATA